MKSWKTKKNKVAFQVSTQNTDKEGHYVLVKGFIDSREITLLYVYRPPGQDKLLVKEILNWIASEASGNLICGGGLQHTNSSKQVNSESLNIRKMLKGIGMFDILRELHPSVKQYTFFSHSHAVYSRLFFQDRKGLQYLG